MLEFLTLIEHAALYLSLPVLCIWSLVRGGPETKFAIWGIMSEYYFANFLKHALHLPDSNFPIIFYSITVELLTAIVIVRSAKSSVFIDIRILHCPFMDCCSAWKAGHWR